MHKKRLVLYVLIAMVLLLGLSSPVMAEVDPAEMTKNMMPGESETIIKKVTTSEIPPLIDIILLEDETASFSDDIATLKALAPDIWDAIVLSGVDFTMGVFGFGDFARQQEGWGAPGDHVVHRHQDLTATKATFVAGVNSLSASGGGDFEEAQLEALHYIATPLTHPAIDSNNNGSTADPEDTPAGQQPTWRPGAQRVILLVTDALCHVTGDPPPPGWPGDAGTTSVAVTGGILDAAHINVIGLVPGGAGTNACVDALAAATGGTVQATTDTGESIKAAILSGLEQLTTDVWWTVNADPGLTVELSPDVHYDVPGGSTVNFTETITVDGAAPVGATLTATVTFWANSYPAEGAIAGEQTITVNVRQVVGGEIADEGNLMVMAPWMALSVIALGGGSAILVRRKALIKRG
ncbi:hypothetical protein ACFLVF_02410 [Chloroflexota bacterium]